MKGLGTILSVYLPAVLFLAGTVFLYVWDMPFQHLADLVTHHTSESYIAFVALLAGATIFMPVTVLPVIPMAAPVFGPFMTGVLSVIGWTLGAAGAFLIARYLGRPVVLRFTSLEKVDALAARIPERMQFLTIVLARMAVPVDVLSYALGFVQSVRFVPYIIATAIGVSWFSFAFAYMGDAFFSHKWLPLVAVGSVSAVLFIMCWYILLRHMRKE